MGKVWIFESPDVVIESDALVGEGPVFDQRNGCLVWVDIDNGTIFENDLTTGRQAVTVLDTTVGAVAPRLKRKGFAAAVGDGFGFVEDGVLAVVDPVTPESFQCMNDAKVDSRGRLWAGSTHTSFVPGTGGLHRWDGTRPSTQVTKGFTLPNGLGWSPDDSVMYLVDSIAQHLLAASYSADAGDIGEFNVLAEINSGLPDGLAVDVEGCIWIAVWGGYEVRRLNPSGELVGIVPMPVAQPSSCAFDSDGTLYITSARAGLTEEVLADQPLAGSVFALSTDTYGVPTQPFGA